MCTEILDSSDYHQFVMEGYESAKNETEINISKNDFRYVEKTVDKFILEPYDIQADKNSFEYRKLCRETAKADLKIIDVQKKRECGDYADEVPDIVHTSPTPSEPTGKQPTDEGKKISEVMELFFSEGDSTNPCECGHKK